MAEAPHPKIDFKRATLADAHELASWIKQYYAYDHIAFHESQVQVALSALLGSDSYGRAYFVRANEKILGYFIFTYGFDVEFGGKLAIVTDLFFAEATRGHGLGSQTLDFIHATCADLKISGIELQVEEDNVEAQKFYEKAGFKKLSRFILSQSVRKNAP